jgi:serine/threonine protein kinase
VRSLQLGAVDYIPKRLLTPERLKTAVKMALRRIEKRVARRLALLAEEAEARARHAAESQAAANAAADEAPSDPMPAPDFIPGYTIRALIGDSEKAAVYLATSATLGHNIALKVSKTMRDDAAGRQFLEREYTAIVAIKDPAVVQIYDYGIHDGHEFIAMEYLPRGDLKARMHQRLTEEEALRFVEQIATALQVVHEAGLLHRDLKPANVMLRENGNIALIDFGLARSLDGNNTQSTRTGVLRGSPYYMSPEQALGEQLDVRSDFYSLGVILFEMLTGRRPFTGSSAMDVLQQHVHSPMPPLPESLAHLEPLLATLLAKSRDERFAKALEVAEAAAAARHALESEPRTTAA